MLEVAPKLGMARNVASKNGIRRRINSCEFYIRTPNTDNLKILGARL